MNKNYTLFAAAALFALIGANINAYTGSGDMFEGLRRSEDQAVQGGEEEPVAGVFERVQTNSGKDELRLKPVEAATQTTGNILGDIFGGRR